MGISIHSFAGKDSRRVIPVTTFRKNKIENIRTLQVRKGGKEATWKNVVLNVLQKAIFLSYKWKNDYNNFLLLKKFSLLFIDFITIPDF